MQNKKERLQKIYCVSPKNFIYGISQKNETSAGFQFIIKLRFKHILHPNLFSRTKNILAMND